MKPTDEQLRSIFQSVRLEFMGQNIVVGVAPDGSVTVEGDFPGGTGHPPGRFKAAVEVYGPGRDDWAFVAQPEAEA